MVRLGTMADARTYVAQCLSTTLAADLDNGSGYIFDDMDEFSRRRAQEAVKWWIKRLDKFAARERNPRR